MENLKKNQKGITLIVLIITIIIMLILVSVTVEVGTGSIDNSKLISFLSYMQTIQGKVDIIAGSEDYSNYGETLTNSNINKLQNVLNSTNESFFTTIDSSSLKFFDSSHIASDLGVDNIDDEVIIDFETREVISLKGIEYEGKIYYTQYNLPGGQKLTKKNEEITRNVTFGEIEYNINGLNATFTIQNVNISNGTLSYGKKNDSDEIKWTTITNYTKKGESVTTSNITESGIYYFKLIDNTSGKDNADSEGNYPSVEMRLTNAPKLEGNLTDLSPSYDYSDIYKSENWAYATDNTDSKYYVWIPRFVYKVDSEGILQEIQFLRGTSDITTSGIYINTSEWIEPPVFTNGTSKKTGVWVEVDSANQTRCKYN